MEKLRSFYNHQVNLVQLQISLGYFKFESQRMLRICLCVNYVPLTFFKLSVHPSNSHSKLKI